MNKLLELTEQAESNLDTVRMFNVMGYIPCYDYIVNFCKRNKYKMENIGGTHFDWYAKISYEEVKKQLLNKYKDYIK